MRIATSPGNFMKNDISIKVNVPQPWRLIGRIFIITAIIIGLIAIWFTFFSNETIEDMVLINTIVMIVAILYTFPFFLPVFIGRYPSWVVRLFGAKFLLKMIGDFETLLSDKRLNRATVANPYSWLSDHRVAWLLILGALVMLGIYYGGLYA